MLLGKKETKQSDFSRFFPDESSGNFSQYDPSETRDKTPKPGTTTSKTVIIINNTNIPNNTDESSGSFSQYDPSETRDKTPKPGTTTSDTVIIINNINIPNNTDESSNRREKNKKTIFDISLGIFELIIFVLKLIIFK
jgi:hypothetical protein